MTFNSGCDNVACLDTSGFEGAIAAAAVADQVVIVIGLDQGQESEGHDRTDISLPGHQATLVQKVAAASRQPAVLIVMAGGSVDISAARDDPHIGAILYVGYPGQSGGTAIAETLFGENNPSGR